MINHYDNTNHYILNNNMIDDTLHVISVIYNPCNYKTRYNSTNKLFSQMETNKHIILYIVELVYGDQEFMVTEITNKNHLQLRTNSPPLWHKENLINLGIKHLLPNNWKAVAWIDVNTEFENPHWACDALKILNEGNDFIQLFTHLINMDYNKNIIDTFMGFGYHYIKQFKKGIMHNYCHPGFAWACNRNTYDKIGGLFQEGILGSGNSIMCHSIINKALTTIKKCADTDYFKFIEETQKKYNGVKLGYVPGNMIYYSRNKEVNINYFQIEDILINYKYNPYTFITTDSNGLIIPTIICPNEFITDIMSYFKGIYNNEITLDTKINEIKLDTKIDEMKLDTKLDEMKLDEILSKPTDDKRVVKYKIDYIFNELEKFKNDLVDVQKDNTSSSSKDSSKNQLIQQPTYDEPKYYHQPQPSRYTMSSHVIGSSDNVNSYNQPINILRQFNKIQKQPNIQPPKKHIQFKSLNFR